MRLLRAGRRGARPLNCGVRRHEMITAQIQLWTDHRQDTFPASARGRDVCGIDLVLLDSLAAGCIDAFVNTDDVLDQPKLALLEDLVVQLRDILPFLELGEREYFERLQRLAQAVLTNAPGRAG